MAELIMKEAKRGEQLRSIEDYDFDFAALLEAAEKDYVAEVRYYCEIKKIKHLFEDKPKLIAMDLEKVRLEPGHSIEGA
jgi:CRISPR-associated protein Csh2